MNDRTRDDLQPDESAHDELVRKVRKLLDKAAATANEHESDAFSRKAAALIAEHRIDPSRLAAVDDELDVEEVELGRGAYVRARLALLAAVAEVHDVEVVFTSRSNGTVALAAGFRADLDVVMSLYTLLHNQAASEAARLRSSTAAATQRDRRSFLFGFAHQTQVLLAAATTSQASQAAQPGSVGPAAAATSAGTELALAERRQRVGEFAAARFGPTRSARPAAAPTMRGYSAGAKAAQRADVGRTRLHQRPQLGAGRRRRT